jgi:hypothetical protein
MSTRTIYARSVAFGKPLRSFSETSLPSTILDVGWVPGVWLRKPCSID